MIFSKNKTPNKRETYSVLHGTYVGEMHVYMKTIDDIHKFLALPDMKIREIPRKMFNDALKNGIIEFVELLPKDVYKICRAQFETTEKDSRGVNKDI